MASPACALTHITLDGPECFPRPTKAIWVNLAYSLHSDLASEAGTPTLHHVSGTKIAASVCAEKQRQRGLVSAAWRWTAGGR